MRFVKLAMAMLLAAAIVWSELTAADFMNTDAEGWHTWQLDAAEPVAEMCCFTRQRGSRSQIGCNLDGGQVSYGSGGDCSAEPGHVKVYALIRNGRPAKIRVLSSECPVATDTPLTDHGVVTANDYVTWFRGVIEDKRTSQNVREEALFGLVQSESDVAYTYIDRLLTGR